MLEAEQSSRKLRLICLASSVMSGYLRVHELLEDELKNPLDPSAEEAAHDEELFDFAFGHNHMLLMAQFVLILSAAKPYFTPGRTYSVRPEVYSFAQSARAASGLRASARRVAQGVDGGAGNERAKCPAKAKERSGTRRRQARTTAADGGRQPVATIPSLLVVTRHRRRHATVASSDFFCVSFGRRANGRVSGENRIEWHGSRRIPMVASTETKSKPSRGCSWRGRGVVGLVLRAPVDLFTLAFGVWSIVIF